MISEPRRRTMTAATAAAAAAAAAECLQAEMTPSLALQQISQPYTMRVYIVCNYIRNGDNDNCSRLSCRSSVVNAWKIMH